MKTVIDLTKATKSTKKTSSTSSSVHKSLSTKKDYGLSKVLTLLFQCHLEGIVTLGLTTTTDTQDYPDFSMNEGSLPLWQNFLDHIVASPHWQDRQWRKQNHCYVDFVEEQLAQLEYNDIDL